MPFQHASPALTVWLFDFRHVNLCCGGYGLWQEHPPVPMRLDEVGIKPQDPKRWPQSDALVAPPAGFDGWFEAIGGKPANLITPREAAYRSVVMEAIYPSAQDFAWVKL